VFHEIVDRAKQDKAREEFIPDAHNTLMKAYGWIPLEEFKKIPIPTLFSLLKKIKEDEKHAQNTFKR